MQKIIRFETVDGYKIFRCAYPRCADAEATIKEIAKRTGTPVLKVRALSNFPELFESYIKYSPLQANEEAVEADRADDLATRYKILGKFETLTTTGEVKADYRGKKFWSLDSAGRWTSVVAAHVNEIPDGVMDENLNSEQQAAINAQKEQDSFDALSPAEKAKKRVAEIDAELETIDRKSGAGRSPREILLELAGSAGLEGDAVSKLMETETYAASLRTERAAQTAILAETEI